MTLEAYVDAIKERLLTEPLIVDFHNCILHLC